MKVVMIESPYEGGGPEAIRYLAWCMLDSVLRGEAPIASHTLYPLCLPERVPVEGAESGREMGIRRRHELSERADETALYVDRGCSPGMLNAQAYDGPERCVSRTLSGWIRASWLLGGWPTSTRWSSTNEGS